MRTGRPCRARRRASPCRCGRLRQTPWPRPGGRSCRGRAGRRGPRRSTPPGLSVRGGRRLPVTGAGPGTAPSCTRGRRRDPSPSTSVRRRRARRRSPAAARRGPAPTASLRGRSRSAGPRRRAHARPVGVGAGSPVLVRRGPARPEAQVSGARRPARARPNDVPTIARTARGRAPLRSGGPGPAPAGPTTRDSPCPPSANDRCRTQASARIGARNFGTHAARTCHPPPPGR